MKRTIAMCLACAMIAGTLPTAAAVSPMDGAGTPYALPEGGTARAQEFKVYDQSSFEAALANATDGDTIWLTGNIATRTITDAPLVLGKRITIEGDGHSLSLGSGGIVLEADVTMRNLSLGQGNMVRNAIMANGHTLTLDNVQQMTNSGRGEFHLFCGSLTGAENNGYTNKNTGTHGRIILSGNSQFAAVYAGNYYDNLNGGGSYGGTSEQGTWTGSSSVEIDSSMTGKVPEIFACGAWMYRSTEAVARPVRPDPDECPITESFSVSLYDSAVERVHGYDGVTTEVVYTGGRYRDDTLRLNLISKLTVKDGYLRPASATFCVDNAPVTVKPGAVLGFNNFTENSNNTGNITIGDFTGGGTITLANNQLLTIAGTISGDATAVALGDYFKGASTEPVMASGWKTLITTQRDEGDFTFIPCSTQSALDEIAFELENGDWKVKSDTVVTPIKSFSIPPLTLVNIQDLIDDRNTIDAVIPFESDFDNQAGSMYYIPLKIWVNGSEASFDTDEGVYFAPIPGEDTKKIAINVTLDSYTQKDVMSIYVDVGSNDILDERLKTGEYHIKVTAPAECTVNGQEITAEGILYMYDSQSSTDPASTPVPFPADNQHFTYDEKEHICVQDTVGYTVTGGTGSATDAGDYKAQLTLKAGYVWSDGSAEKTREISWSIGKATKPEIPEGLLRVNAPYEQLDGSITDGMLIGTTREMEYRRKGAGDWAPCGDGVTVIQTPGDYEVRYKFPNESNWEESPALELTVPAAVTLDSIAIATPPTRTQYIVGADESTLDLSGMELTLRWSDSAENTLPVTDAAAQGVTASGADFSTAGENEIEITFRGKSASFTVKVVDWSITGIAVNSTGHKTVYQVGEPIDLTGLTISVEHDGTSDTVGVTESMISGFDTTAPGTHSVTITYEGYTAAFEITVEGGEQPPEERWPVTVSGSGAEVTGAGSYAEGDTVTVTVGTREGYTFAGWLTDGVTFDAAALLERTLTFPMPGNAVTLTARWRQDITEPDGGRDTTGRKPNSGGSSNAGKPTTPAPAQPETPAAPETPAETVWNNPYTADVSPREWYYEAVRYVSESGLMSGTGNGTFSPEVKLSRGMLAQILYNQEGRPSAGGNSFTDVPVGEWFTDAVSWAASNAIVSGYSSGAFGPSDDITREQFILILYRYAQMKGYDVSVSGTANLLGYADASQISDYAREAMAWACEKGLISGTNRGMLAPTGGATRAEAAAILMRFLQSVK